jgi:hypothetical protein
MLVLNVLFTVSETTVPSWWHDPCGAPIGGGASRLCLCISCNTGFVSIRASEYSLRWDTAIARSCGVQDGQGCYSAAEEQKPPASGRNVLVVTGSEAEEVAEFVVSAVEPDRRSGALEAAYRPCRSRRSCSSPLLR